MKYLLLLSLFSHCLGQTCYYRTGEISSADSPCPNPNGASHVACCGKQSDGSPAYCLSNNLCMADMKVSRGSCTDQSWQDEGCPQYCQGSNDQGGWALTPCFVSGQGLLFACSNCTKSSFTLEEGNFILNAEQKSSLGLATATPSSTTSPTSATASGTANAALSAAPTATLSSSNSNQVVAVGAGVGVSLGCALIAALILFAWQRSQYLALRRKINSSPSQQELVNYRPPPKGAYEAQQDAHYKSQQSGAGGGQWSQQNPGWGAQQNPMWSPPAAPRGELDAGPEANAVPQIDTKRELPPTPRR